MSNNCYRKGKVKRSEHKGMVESVLTLPGLGVSLHGFPLLEGSILPLPCHIKGHCVLQDFSIPGLQTVTA